MEVDFTKLYRQAEMLWIRHVQREILKSDKYPQKRSSLALYQDEEGILRCQRRTGMSSLHIVKSIINKVCTVQETYGTPPASQFPG